MEKLIPAVIGSDTLVVKLNNAATTSPFVQTADAVHKFFDSYGALHRGAGPHANKTVEIAEQAIATIREFFGVSAEQAMLYTSNTSAAINELARLMVLTNEDVILTSCIEHTSNNLPWRYNTKAKIVEVSAFSDGSLDMDDLEEKAKKYSKQLKWIAMTGASNLAGFVPDVKRLSAIAHLHGARLFIDAAQLAPHRPINMKKQGIDALAFSAHKIYSPFGLGVLVLPKDMLERTPVDPGGGSIDMISTERILWAPSAERHQTGTWNVVGIVALAESCRIMTNTGWSTILKHERDLIQYAVKRLSGIPDVIHHVPLEKFKAEDRIGTFPFTLKGYHHALVAAILDHEYGIETRAGTICNHRLVRRWFAIDDKTQEKIEERIKNGDRLASYGAVRASLGIFNTTKDIDRLVDALISIQKNGPSLSYKPSPKEETYIPVL
ncbi:MAG: aminotransferase class V-fold PLP-dependent enzyme [Patescibacteria group bacterium]|jgi:selenocysteine lyase/cysteine desulfurase